MPRVTLEDRFFGDAAFREVASDTGLHIHHVRGACAEVWHQCLDALDDTLTARRIDAIAEHKGFAAALVAAGLASEGESGFVVLHGMAERIRSLLDNSAAQRARVETRYRNGREADKKLPAVHRRYTGGTPAEYSGHTPGIPSVSVSVSVPVSDPDREVEPQLVLVPDTPAVDVDAVHAAAFASYPASRRVGKSKGLEALRRSVTTPADAERFRRVVAAHVASASEEKYLRQWERLCRTWGELPEVAPARASPDARRGSIRPSNNPDDYAVGEVEF